MRSSRWWRCPLSTAALKRRLRAVSRLHKAADASQQKLRTSTFDLDFLPRNDALEYAIGRSIFDHQDARSTLQFTKQLMDANLLSLASPVGLWDPYDIKPQVFALDTYLALPVFTSLRYLGEFCARFDFHVRDPSGNVWVDPTAMHERLDAPQQDPQSEPSSGKEAMKADISPQADDLFSQLELDATSTDPRGEKKKAATRRGKGTRRRRKMRSRPSASEGKSPGFHLPDDLLEGLQSVKAFGIRKATPLPIFGPLLRPYFVGYFADVETLLCNAAIVPEKVDIVVNPVSPLEIVLSREATDRVLSRDTLILNASLQLEKQYRSEFHAYLSAHCPEVQAAYSACIAKSHNSALYHNYIDYNIVIVIRSDDVALTWEKLRHAKASNLLRNHPALEVQPEDAVMPHVRSAATLFYSAQPLMALTSDTTRHQGKMRQVGCGARVAVGVNSGSYFSDPSNFYTEASSVFSDSLKFK